MMYCYCAGRRALVLSSTVLLVALLPSCRQATPTSPDPRALSSFDPQVKALLAKMTLDEKIGQMTQAMLSPLGDLTDIQKYCLGSVLSGGDSDPAEGNSLEAWTNFYDRCQQQALGTRLGIPILYGIDAVHGHNNVLGAVIFPHNIGLGCTRDPKLVEQIAHVTAVEVRATGINWTFAPCVTVPRDQRWGRTYEGFSEDPELVSLLGPAAVRGYQGKNLDDPLSILACAKHYVGDGATTPGTGPFSEHGLDQGDTRVDEATLRSVHLKPYIPALAAGVGSIMPSYSSWNGVKCSANKYLLTDVLKNELGFKGFLISDFNAVDQLATDYKDAVEIAINAGMDMVMEPDQYREFIKDLKELVEEGRVPMSRIDDAVTRILRVKFAMGLMDKDRSTHADRSLQTEFGSAAHRALAREAVRQSLVLLKNERNVLPLAKQGAHIHVAGKNADDLGNQCGGWTIDWQGRGGDVTPGGTTILAAIKAAAGTGSEVTFSEDGTGAEKADVGVVVIGETPYAEGNGDSLDLALAEEDVAAVKNMKKAGIPVVVVLVSGRPIILGDVLDEADALVAAWLPGTEGQGVADVLFGDYAPSGKLSFTWPRSIDQLPINVGDKQYDPLFPYGFGLSYAK
jgi:beta-glucosidase